MLAGPESGGLRIYVLLECTLRNNATNAMRLRPYSLVVFPLLARRRNLRKGPSDGTCGEVIEEMGLEEPSEGMKGMARKRKSERDVERHRRLGTSFRRF